jgi:hypothetical protein
MDSIILEMQLIGNGSCGRGDIRISIVGDGQHNICNAIDG